VTFAALGVCECDENTMWLKAYHTAIADHFVGFATK
jgi:hypothetical protein